MKPPSTHYYDFIIIGGGIAGASIGYELSKLKKVLLLEREDAFGYHTTGRSAATYVELLHNQTIVALSRASKDFLINPPDGFTQTSILKTCACLVTAKACEQAELNAAFQSAVKLGTEVKQLNLDEIIAQVPVTRKNPDFVHSGILEPQAQRIDVDSLLQGYLRGIKKQGSTARSRAKITYIARPKDLWQLKIQADDTTWETPVIINAAGAWADSVAMTAGVKPIGLIPKRRTMITFDGPKHLDFNNWPMLADLGNHFYFIPEVGQLMGSPADENPSPPCDAQPAELDIATAIFHIEQYTHLKIKKINHKWAGLRTFAPDQLPVIGFDPSAEGFFWLAGQGGFGIQTAPALAQLGTAIACQQNPQEKARSMSVNLAAILPDRFR